MQQGWAAYRATGANVRQPMYLAPLAEAYGQAGQVDEGLQVLAEALAYIEQAGELVGSRAAPPQGRAATLAVCRQPSRSCILLRASPGPGPPPAGKSWELRAATSLARLWQHQGKRAEAMSCWHRPTAGSPKALTPPTSRRPRRCWRIWDIAQGENRCEYSIIAHILTISEV